MADNLHLDKRADVLIELAHGNPDDLLTTKELAAWFGVSVQWVELGRMRGYGPPPTYLSQRCVRYHRQVVLDWLDERVQILVAGGTEYV